METKSNKILKGLPRKGLRRAGERAASVHFQQIPGIKNG
jgi:hypothetical protein